MLIDRYDKNGKQIGVGDYLLRYDGEIFKVDYDPNNLMIGVKDKDSIYFSMADWVKEDWEIKDYYELYPPN
jgi:hypothetical protein